MAIIKGKIDKYYILNTLKKNEDIFKKYGVINIGLFGSYILGRHRKNSDIDLLVDFKKNSNDNYLYLLSYIETLFPGFKIELTKKKNIRKEYKKNILGTVVYAKGDIRKRLIEIAKKIKKELAMGEKDYAIYLTQMKEKIAEITESIKDTKSFKEFEDNIILHKAVRLDLIDLGNIANKIMEYDEKYNAGILTKIPNPNYNGHNEKNKFINYYKDINLSEIYGHRNVIDHGYNDVDYNKVYKVATVNIPELDKKVDRAIEELHLQKNISVDKNGPDLDIDF